MGQIFDLFVHYSQLDVFDPDLESPGNDWREVHVAQGFAWRPGSVAFGTLTDSDPLRVTVQQVTNVAILPDAIRAIVVPFIVSPCGRVGLSDVIHDVEAPMPPGPYALVFETGFLTDNPEDGTWVRLSFVPQESAEPAILRADAGLNPPDTLDMQADSV